MKQTNDLYTLHSICIVRYQCDIPGVRKEEKRKKVMNVIYNKRNREKNSVSWICARFASIITVVKQEHHL